MSTFDTPRFQHDCPACKFLGQYRYADDPNKRYDYDLYVCGQAGSIPTVIARFSDDGPDYMSGIHGGLFVNVNGVNPTYPLTVALYQAVQEGYLRISATPKLKEADESKDAD